MICTSLNSQWMVTKIISNSLMKRPSWFWMYATSQKHDQATQGSLSIFKISQYQFKKARSDLPGYATVIKTRDAEENWLHPRCQSSRFSSLQWTCWYRQGRLDVKCYLLLGQQGLLHELCGIDIPSRFLSWPPVLRQSDRSLWHFSLQSPSLKAGALATQL